VLLLMGVAAPARAVVSPPAEPKAGIKMLPPEQADNMGSDCSTTQGDKILTWDGTLPTKCHKNVTIESSALVVGTASGGTLLHINAQDAANEGAQIVLRGAGSYDWWYPDVYQNHMRFYSNSTHDNQVQIFNNGSGTSDLYVEGSVQVGNDTAACASEKAGAIRWTGTAMEYCNATAWVSFGPTSLTATRTDYSGASIGFVHNTTKVIASGSFTQADGYIGGDIVCGGAWNGSDPGGNRLSVSLTLSGNRTVTATAHDSTGEMDYWEIDYSSFFSYVPKGMPWSIVARANENKTKNGPANCTLTVTKFGS